MKKTDWQYLVDTLLFICMAGIAFIGFLMGLVLAEGPTVREIDKYFLGLHRHQWGDMHFYLSIAFVVLIIIHLILSWSWIRGKTRQLFKKRWGSALILTAIIPVLVIFLFWYFSPKNPSAYESYGKRSGERARNQSKLLNKTPVLPKEGTEEKKESQKIKEEEKRQEIHEEEPEEKITRGKRAEDQSGILITGRMTFYDIEKETGIPARNIADKLGLPANTSLNETLGRLRKKYGFTIQEVKDVVSSLIKKWGK